MSNKPNHNHDLSDQDLPAGLHQFLSQPQPTITPEFQQQLIFRTGFEQGKRAVPRLSGMTVASLASNMVLILLACWLAVALGMTKRRDAVVRREPEPTQQRGATSWVASSTIFKTSFPAERSEVMTPITPVSDGSLSANRRDANQSTGDIDTPDRPKKPLTPRTKLQLWDSI